MYKHFSLFGFTIRTLILSKSTNHLISDIRHQILDNFKSVSEAICYSFGIVV